MREGKLSLSSKQKRLSMKVELKLKKKSHKDYMRLGKHKVTRTYKAFDLDKSEEAQLKTDKGITFFSVKREEKKEVKK